MRLYTHTHTHTHTHTYNLDNERGITLVALVVTIVVLLILAGISISLVLGENGLITQAQEAKRKTQESYENETNAMNFIENEIKNSVYSNDQNPGKLEGSGTKEDPYVVNSAEDFIFLQYDVTNGNTFDGKIIKLDHDIDFNANNAYVNPNSLDYKKYGYNGEIKKYIHENGISPIGITNYTDDDFRNSHSFKGELDGNGKTISNLKMNCNQNNTGYNAYGLFAYCLGNIHDLYIENCDYNIKIASNKFMGIGILVGTLGAEGKITNCHVSGNMNVYSGTENNIGGIVGANCGEVSNCYSSANIKSVFFDSKESNPAQRCGGLAGVNEATGNIKNCYFNGTFEITQNEESSSRCFRTYAGGVCGYNLNEIDNVYNVGTIKETDKENKAILIGGSIGTDWNGTGKEVNVCYYLENCILISTENGRTISTLREPKTEEYLKSDEFINELNSKYNGIWKKDIKNINDGYPILNWQ